ncbi:hypothetical protein ACWGS9_13815 [Bradyrhizobium sp. Arg314]
MREYSKVSPKVWQSRRFRSQSDDSRLFYLYLLTCEHQSSAGCFRLPDAYAAENLNWSVERVQAARAPLIADEMLAYDDEAFEYFIRRWFRHNPTANPKHLQGVNRLISELDSAAIQDPVESELNESLEAKSKATNVSPLADVRTAGDHLMNSRYLAGFAGNRRA